MYRCVHQLFSFNNMTLAAFECLQVWRTRFSWRNWSPWRIYGQMAGSIVLSRVCKEQTGWMDFGFVCLRLGSKWWAVGLWAVVHVRTFWELMGALSYLYRPALRHQRQLTTGLIQQSWSVTSAISSLELEETKKKKACCDALWLSQWCRLLSYRTEEALRRS